MNETYLTKSCDQSTSFSLKVDMLKSFTGDKKLLGIPEDFFLKLVAVKQ